MPRVLIATLCDDVREEVGGKNSLMGVFNTFYVSDFRNPINTFWIFARLEFDQDGEYPIVVEFRTIEGQSIFQVRGNVNVQRSQQSQIEPTANLKFRVIGLRFPRHGVYELAILHNDQMLHRVYVEVVVPPPRFVQ